MPSTLFALLLLAAPPPCDVTVCMAGAFTRADGANPVLARACRAAKVVEDCSGAQCEPLFAFAGIKAAQAALFKRLDTNADGAVDAKDAALRICLVGYSWGGVNSGLLAQAFLTDPKVAPARRHIEHLVLIDPFAPMTKAVTVPPGVRNMVNHRHSIAPRLDCSRRAPMGPYKGLPAACPKGAACADVDHSKADPRVGHCSIVRRVMPAVQRLIGPATPPGSPTP